MISLRSRGGREKIDEGAGKITLKHGPAKSLGMDEGMTMVYRVRDPAMLKQVKAGDKVTFEAVEGMAATPSPSCKKQSDGGRGIQKCCEMTLNRSCPKQWNMELIFHGVAPGYGNTEADRDPNLAAGNRRSNGVAERVTCRRP